MNDRTVTLHPDHDKRGVNISRTKYDSVREAIISTFSERDELTFTELGAAVNERLEGHFEGSISWYFTTVKLDLEARGIVERVGHGSPQRIRLRASHRSE